jgi:hypothetical protein
LIIYFKGVGQSSIGISARNEQYISPSFNAFQSGLANPPTSKSGDLELFFKLFYLFSDLRPKKWPFS